MVIGLAVRLAPFGMTFTDAGVRFRSDTDPYYHALRAQRTVEHWPHVPWTDPNMNFPYGARIPWPPLFDFVIAAFARLFGATATDTEAVAKVAAWLALALGLALVPLVARLGQRVLGGGLWLDAALIVALVSGSIRFGAVGAADQHGAELLISCGIFLAFVAGWRDTRPPARERLGYVWLGFLIAVAFWNWLGSALYLLLLDGVTGLWHVVAPPGDAAARRMARTLFGGGLVATALLAASITLFAPSGSLGAGGLNGLTGLHVAMVAASAMFGGFLTLSSRIPGGPKRRLLVASAAAAVALLPVALIAPLREGIAQGLLAVTRGNAWYASISEYRPILFSGVIPLAQDVLSVLATFGLGLFVMPLALPAFWRRWKSNVVDRPALFFLFLFGAMFLSLTLYELRFQLYLTVPMALWVAFALRDLASRAAEHWQSRSTFAAAAIRTTGVIVVIAPALLAVYPPAYADQLPGFESDLFPALEWLRNVPATDPSRPAVMAEWSAGHAIQYFANKPVIVTPFGTALDEGSNSAEQRSGMEDWSAFLFATNPGDAERILLRRRVGFVVLRSPKSEVVGAFGFAPRGTAPVADLQARWIKGPLWKSRPLFFHLIPSRLYYFDGVSPNIQTPALGQYRLLYESPDLELIARFPPAHLFKTFGVVPGARIILRGSLPGGAITARARIQTNQNRTFDWIARTAADEAGRAELRLPYATGANGLVRAGSYSISDGVHSGTLDLDERDVTTDATMEIDFAR